jgi:site-specific recombinase XerC
MHQLPNNCSCSEFIVLPFGKKRDYKKATQLDFEKTWSIYYRFYEPNRKVKQVPVKGGINRAKTLKEKIQRTKDLIEDEIKDLRNGYNPNDKEIIVKQVSEVSPETPLRDALQWSFGKMKAEAHTREDIKSTLKYINQAIESLDYNYLKTGEVKRRHVLSILDKCEAIKKTFTANTYNHYRKYLSMLFTELVIYEAIETNPVDKYLPKRKGEKKIKKILSKEERLPLYSLKETNYTFWRFLNIFFHSSRRTTEMLAVKKEHVDLKNQKFQVLMKKGKGGYNWIWVTIEDKALDFWKEIMSEAKEGEYLFAEDLKPGKRDSPIRTDQIKRRWNVHVKQKLGITATFYTLKHSHLEAIAEEKGIEAAQKSAGHSSKVITMVYTPGEKEREHQRRKSHGGEL